MEKKTFFLLFIFSLIFNIVYPYDENLEEAYKILNENQLIDAHNDLPWKYRENWEDRVYINTTNLYEITPELNTDIPRLRAGEVGGQFWSVFVDCAMESRDAVRATMEQIDNVYKFVSRYSDTFEIALTAEDAKNAFNAGKIASFIGMEGGHSVDSSLGALRMFYKLGARYMGLTHNCNTPWADSCCAPEGFVHNGLTHFGEDIVREMNRIGMMIDLSHASEEVMNEAIAISSAPVIFSHSNAFEICPNARNVPSSVLSQLISNGGVVMVSFYPPFVTCSDYATISDVADHIDYIVSICGEGCVGIGADFDGISIYTTGLENVSKYPYLFAELISRGYSNDSLAKIAGGNIMRVLERVETVAKEMQTSTFTFPHEKTIYPDSTFLQKTCRSKY